MTEENFNKAPGSEFSKSRTTVVTKGNIKTIQASSCPSALTPSAMVNQDFPYTILQYGHLLPTLVQPCSVFHHPAPPPPPMPVTIPVFYQPVNGGSLPHPQPFDSNMFYRCVPQLPSGNDTLLAQKVCWNMNNVKVVHSKAKRKELTVEVCKSDTMSVSSSDTPLSPVVPLSPDSTRDVGFGGTGIVVNQEKLVTLTEMAMQGCELAEQLAINHQKRPCFKKIDSLCARMKQDLIRPDSVLANINSQGIAWAVKDFIFVFTRIINAWIIIKGYVYNTPEGLERVQKVLSADFLDHFLKWQDSTIDFVDSLIKSFTNLDQTVQTQRTSGVQKESSPRSNGSSNRQSKTDEEKERNIHELYEYLKDIIPSLAAENKSHSTADSTSSSDLSDRTNTSAVFDNTATNKNYLFSVVNDSENTQMKHNENGTYLKTGIYEPVKKPPGFGPVPTGQIPLPPLVDTASIPFATSTPKILKNPIAHDRIDLLSSTVGKGGNSTGYEGETQQQTTADVTTTLFAQQQNPLQMDFFNDAIIRQSFDSETVAKIHFLLQKVFGISEANYFMVAQFTRNYTINPTFKDLRAIISKAQIGGYKTIKEIVHDLRQIVLAARRYLEQKSSALLKETTDKFERSLEDILSDKIFDCYDFGSAI